MASFKTINLDLPARNEDLSNLEIGSVAYLSGRIFTAREGVYQRAIEDGAGMPLRETRSASLTSIARRPRLSIPTAAILSALSPRRHPSVLQNGSTAGSNYPAATSSSAKAA